MKEYDIFLKQRLTEGSIIVYSLPFRDGVLHWIWNMQKI